MSPARLLGYLNFSQGHPDPGWQRQLNDAFTGFALKGEPEPWRALVEWLLKELPTVKSADGAFKDATQAEAALRLVLKILSAYRAHHRDLFFHLGDAELFQPFFLARAFEALLAEGAPWEEARIVKGALHRLNDFVGYRPLAVLETEPRIYDHERFRPIPLYLRGAGVAWGRYAPILERAIDILKKAERSQLEEAQFDLNLLDELALDPRAYDHSHPANRRPNFVFGEWDPHHLDSQGRHRRFVVRQIIFDALAQRAEGEGNREELLFESAAVVAGTMLMASSICGRTPHAHDSTMTLATLIPTVARFRDAFYRHLITTVPNPHLDRLQREAEVMQQPFGGARQFLNQYLTRHRAAQLQQRMLGLLFAEMGYAKASRQEAGRIAVVSVRMLSEILIRLTTAGLLADRRYLGRAARLLPQVEDWLKRGIACGAFVDPWNILGYQGLFPLFAAREDAIRDPRVDELIEIVDRIFSLYGRLMSEAAAAGRPKLVRFLRGRLRRLAEWWDQFGSIHVADIPQVHGAKALLSAQQTAAVLARWHAQGDAGSDLAFWRDHLGRFRHSESFATVVDTLCRRGDFRSAMALLVQWCSQADEIPLEEGDVSFHQLALRWMLAVAGSDTTVRARPATPDWPLAKKFLDFLEANAEDYWNVPNWGIEPIAAPSEEREETDSDVFKAAYEDVTYRDSTDDDNEGAILDPGLPREYFRPESEGPALEQRLRFLSTVARLWQIAARCAGDAVPEGQRAEAMAGWLTSARSNYRNLLQLLDAIDDCDVPEPSGSHDSMIEYDRRRLIKEQLLQTAIGTCLDTAMAMGGLQAAIRAVLPRTLVSESSALGLPWELPAIRLEEALVRSDVAEARRALAAFLAAFRPEPLLFTPLGDGGQPRQVLRVRLAQSVLRAVASNLPRLGLLHETYEVLKAAHEMEQMHPPQGRSITEYNHLYQAAYQAVIETVASAARTWEAEQVTERRLVDLFEALTAPFLRLWVDHSRTLQLSVLESGSQPAEWTALRDFIQHYGADLFQPKFLTLANLRGILHRGVGDYLDYLRDNPDPVQPVRLIDDLDGKIRRPEAVRRLQFVLQAVVENYEEYKDYKTSTTQSDYGDKLFAFLDFLRVKANYERYAWQFRPLAMAHEVLARNGLLETAAQWMGAFAASTESLAEQFVSELGELEKVHGFRLGTVADRLQERFVKPLALDRLCACIEPAMQEAGRNRQERAFHQLEEQLRYYAATPAGSGLDIPYWLRRMEQEVHRVRGQDAALVQLAEDSLGVPRRLLTYEEVQDAIKALAKEEGKP